MKRESTKFFKVVNFDKEDNAITVLDEIFLYKDGFKGATGSKFEPVSREKYAEVLNMTDDEIADYLIDAGFELPESYKKGGFIEWVEQFDDNDKLSLFFDLSYSEKWEDLRSQTGLSEDEARIFNCVGGGRCFDKDFEGNMNPELSELIRKAES